MTAILGTRTGVFKDHRAMSLRRKKWCLNDMLKRANEVLKSAYKILGQTRRFCQNRRFIPLKNAQKAAGTMASIFQAKSQIWH